MYAYGRFTLLYSKELTQHCKAIILQKNLIQNDKNENNRINEKKIKSHRPKMTSENFGLKTYRYYLQNT